MKSEGYSPKSEGYFRQHRGYTSSIQYFKGISEGSEGYNCKLYLYWKT